MSAARERITPEIRIGRKREGMIRYSVSEDKLREIAVKAGALVDLGKVKGYDFKKIDAYFDQLTEQSAQ